MEIRRTHTGQKAGTGWTKVTRGVHRRSDSADPESAALHGWVAALPRTASFTHLTGARLLGLWLPPGLDNAPPVAQVPPRTNPPERAGLRVIRTEPVARPGTVRGLPVASVADVLLSLCRDLDDLDALQAVDAALHLELTTPDLLGDVAGLRRRGAPRLRRVLELADGRSESAWETVLREFHRVVGAPVTPQYEVFDASGFFVARGDLRLDGTKMLHEYDGEVHRTGAQHLADLRRERHLTAAGWTRRGFSSVDLVSSAGALLADVDRSLGRRHDRARVRPWHEAIRTSAVTPAGRQALRSRLGLPNAQQSWS